MIFLKNTTLPVFGFNADAPAAINSYTFAIENTSYMVYNNKGNSRRFLVEFYMKGIRKMKTVANKELLMAGVKIYEYTPGFVHAKAFVADDTIAGIGTVNLDYRSLFLHFECNAVFYKADIIEELKQDYLNTQAECVERTMNDVKKGIIYNLENNFLRIIAPLM